MLTLDPHRPGGCRCETLRHTSLLTGLGHPQWSAVMRLPASPTPCWSRQATPADPSLAVQLVICITLHSPQTAASRSGTSHSLVASRQDISPVVCSGGFNQVPHRHVSGAQLGGQCDTGPTIADQHTTMFPLALIHLPSRRFTHCCQVAGHQRQRLRIVGDQAAAVQDDVERVQDVSRVGGVVVGV